VQHFNSFFFYCGIYVNLSDSVIRELYQILCYMWTVSDTVLYMNRIRYCVICELYQILCYMWTVSDTVLYVKCIRYCVIFPFHTLKELYITGKKYAYLPHLTALRWKAVPTFNLKRDILKVLPGIKALSLLWNLIFVWLGINGTNN
jgi:hypothetical protein